MIHWIFIAILLFAFLIIAVRGRRPQSITAGRIPRALRLLVTAVSAGAGVAMSHILQFLSPARKRQAVREAQQHRAAQQAVKTMGSMKGVAMKMGQIVSFLDDVVPPAVAQSLRPLQKQAPALDFDIVCAVLENELGAPPEHIFAQLSPTPLAAASIGQVHSAVRRDDGRAVAVKVQYPGVADAIRADLANVGTLARMIGLFTPAIDANAMASELRERILEELDYAKEARNQEHFCKLYIEDADLVIPRVHADLSTERVLTSDLCSGRDFYDFCREASEPAKQRAGLALHRFVFESIWHHQVFNADPHPGNFLFADDGRVVCLDFGSVKHFSDDFLSNMSAMTGCYLDSDRDGFYEQARRMRFILPGQEHRVDKEWLWEYVQWYHEPILRDEPFTYSRDYTRQATSKMFGDNMRKVNMPAEYVMLTRITFGVNSLLVHLGARHNWHRLARGYLTARRKPAMAMTMA